jgi:hypothetical protein
LMVEVFDNPNFSNMLLISNTPFFHCAHDTIIPGGRTFGKTN